MKRNQTISGNLRQVLWICALVLLYSFHALDIVPAHASSLLSFDGSEIAYDNSSKCHELYEDANNSHQGNPRVRFCSHCINASNFQYEHIVPVKISRLIETLVPVTRASDLLLEREELLARPKDLFGAFLATRGPPLFSYPTVMSKGIS